MNMDDAQPLLRLENVSKVFVTDEVETHALQSIHFDVKKGEYLSISGPSGCGKSTLLAILGLLDTPTDGTYYLNGKPVAFTAIAFVVGMLLLPLAEETRGRTLPG